MDYRFLLNGIKNILLNPIKFWESLNSDNIPVKTIRDSFLLPLIILISLALTAGSLIFFNTELSAIYSIILGIKRLVVLLLTVYLSSFMLGEITYPLDLGKNFSISFRLIVFSLTPFMLCQIVSSLFESLLFLNVFGLYGFYIFLTGADVMLKPPQHKRVPMLISTAVVIAAIYILSDTVLTILTNKIYYSYLA
jgi:hypothetical protein